MVDVSPFVVIKYAEKEFKTKIINGQGKSTNYDEHFKLGTGDEAEEVLIQMFHDATIGTDLIGESKLTTEEMKTGGGGKEVKDMFKEGEKTGWITMRFRYKVPKTA